MSADKSQKPTPKRLRDAARDGDLLQSRDLSAALVTGAGVIWLWVFGAAAFAGLKAMLASGLAAGPGSSVTFPVRDALYGLIRPIAGPVGGLMLIAVMASLVPPVFLGSFGFRLSALTPKWSRIDPLSGLRRMTGIAGLSELAKSVAKVALIGGAGAIMLYVARWDVIALAASDVVRGATTAASIINHTLVTMALLLGAIAIVDVPIQSMRRNKRLGMSRDEVTREQREAEGSPELKRERRGRQYAMATMSARAAMTEASVVVTNPTHFAVALRYDAARDDAPLVVARGVDEAASAIRDLAKSNGVPCLEYPALARAIFFTSRVGDRICGDLYLAVATVLAFVMNLEAALVAQQNQPEIDVPELMRFGTDGRREA